MKKRRVTKPKKAETARTRSRRLDAILRKVRQKDEALRVVRRAYRVLQKENERLKRALQNAEAKSKAISEALKEQAEEHRAALREERKKERRLLAEEMARDLEIGERVGPLNRLRDMWREVETLRRMSTRQNPFTELVREWAIRNNVSVSLVWTEYRRRNPWRGTHRRGAA